MTGKGRSAPIRIWALLGARAGDNNQVIALAKAIGLPFEIKQLEYNALHLLGPRLLGRSLISLTRRSRGAVLAEPPPDLTISAGHRSVAVVRALRHRSGSRTRSIHLGFPRISPGHFDLVIATPQYPIPDHPNFLRIPYALTPAAFEEPDPIDEARLTSLPRSRPLLIVGGPTLFWNLDETKLLEKLLAMIEQARAAGGSLLVATSPRTPPTLTPRITGVLDASGVPFVLGEPRKRPGLPSLLAAADSISVTADSVSMVSDAISTGKPVELLRVRKSALGKLAFLVNDVIRPGCRLYPQDLRFFWRALSEIGVSERRGRSNGSTSEPMQLIMARVRPILESLE